MNVDRAIATLIISKNPKINSVKKFLFKHKLYTDWGDYLKFAIANLKKDVRLTKEEQDTVENHRLLIKRLTKSKRPNFLVKKEIDKLTPLIELILKYEQ